MLKFWFVLKQERNVYVSGKLFNNKRLVIWFVDLKCWFVDRITICPTIHSPIGSTVCFTLSETEVWLCFDLQEPHSWIMDALKHQWKVCSVCTVTGFACRIGLKATSIVWDTSLRIRMHHSNSVATHQINLGKDALMHVQSLIEKMGKIFFYSKSKQELFLFISFLC